MAVLGTTTQTMRDIVALNNGKGGILPVAEVLAQSNPILQDAHWEECNETKRHKIAVRTELPKSYWKEMGVGVPSSKSQKQLVAEAVGRREGWSVVEEDELSSSNDPVAYRANEAAAHIEGLAQEDAETCIYGDTNIEEKGYLGFAPRISDPSALNGKRLFNGGGIGSDNGSIYLVGWGPRKVYMTYPKGGTTAGITRNDLGKMAETIDGKNVINYKEQFYFEHGLVVEDSRYLARACNIDVAKLNNGDTDAANIINLMVKMIHSLPAQGAGSRLVFYTTNTIAAHLDIQSLNKGNVLMPPGMVEGIQPVSMRGAPIYGLDAMLDTEAAISFA